MTRTRARTGGGSGRRRFGWIAVAAALAVFLPAGAVSAGDGPKAPAGKKEGAEAEADLSRYEVIKYINPFSPEPPKKPQKPKPKVKPKPKPPPKKVKEAPKNLHFAGVTWDNEKKSFKAMVEVDGKGPVFLAPGGEVGAFKVLRVDMSGMRLKKKGGDLKAVSLGETFHDGETYITRIVGGSESAAEKAAPPPSSHSGSSSSSSSLSEAKKREIIERLKAKRQAAMKNRK